MADKLTIENGKMVLTTDEGRTFKMPESKLIDMLRSEIEAPIDGAAMPDGVKFLKWQFPFLCVVHQLAALVRKVRWITKDSPVPYGPEAKFEMRRLSMPYAITFAIYWFHSGRLSLMKYNELYFRNEPLTSKADGLGYAALLNISRIDLPKRQRAWICTEHLRHDTKAGWDAQLAALLNHTWNGGFNLSSEHHEGASWYGESKEIHPDLHPIQRWEKATKKKDAFALGVPWKPAALNVGQLMDAMLDECQQRPTSRALNIRQAKPKSQSLPTRLVNYAQTT